MADQDEPRLAPPGAGLPKVELIVARLLFRYRRATGSRDGFTALFQRERQAIAGMVASCDPVAAGTRVLIERVPGLEDSSRYWSVWMTLEHLRIMHTQVAVVFLALGQGREPSGKASTANVKPGTDIGPEVLAPYETSCDRLLELVAAIPDLKTKARFAHPWFGPMDAWGWYSTVAGHLGIHRAQISRIIAGLPQARGSDER